MTIIYKIKITRAELEKKSEANQYQLKLDWIYEQNPTNKYEGPFWLVLESNGIRSDVRLFYGDSHAEFDNLILDPENSYEATITASESFITSCNKVKLLLHTYEDVYGEYDNNKLKITWSKNDVLSDSGVLTVQPQNNHSFMFPLISNTYHTEIQIPKNDLKENEVWETFLIPKWSEITYGIQSDLMKIFTKELNLIKVDKTETGLRVYYSLPNSGYQEKEQLRVQFVITQNGKERYKSKKNPVVETQEKMIFAEDIVIESSELLKELELCELAGYLGTENTCNLQQTPKNRISLAAPDINLEFLPEKKVLLTWNYKNDNCNGFQIFVNQTQQPGLVYGDHFIFENGEDVVDTRISAAPIIGNIRGVISKEKTIFCPAYYEHNIDGISHIHYNNYEYREMIATVFLPAAIFEQPVMKALQVGPISIRPYMTGYYLSLDKKEPFSELQFEEFIELLFTHQISIDGYYTIRNILTRIVSPDLDHLLYYYCGIKKNSYVADIMPGMILSSETAAYQKQSSANLDDNNGFIRNGVSEYHVSLVKYGHSSVLEFNNFIGQIASSFNNNEQPESEIQSYQKNYGGLIDLFHTNLRKPFYRLVYPTTFLDSKYPGTPYPSDNVTIAAASRYSELKEVDTMTVNHLDIPHVVLRGRSSVSLKISIFVNGCPIHIDLGTTLSGLMQQYSISFLEKRAKAGGLRLFRETGILGEGTREFVFKWFNDEALFYKIPLLPGDRIEFV